MVIVLVEQALNTDNQLNPRQKSRNTVHVSQVASLDNGDAMACCRDTWAYKDH